MFWSGILENLVSDAIFVLIAILLGWIISVLTRRAKLLRFYRVETSRRIVVYLSNIRVTPGGSIGIDGQRRSYQGFAVDHAEMSAAQGFRDRFNYLLPSLSDKPGILSKLLISDVQVQIEPSPLTKEQVEASSSFIALGSPAYNAASMFIEGQHNSSAKFSPAQKGSLASEAFQDTIPRSEVSTASVDFDESLAAGSAHPSESLKMAISGSLSDAYQHSPAVSTVSLEDQNSRPAICVDGLAPFTDTTYGFVERIVDHNRGRCLFYAAGLSVLGTIGAAHFLAAKWLKLYRKYGKSTSFLIMLRFRRSDFKQSTIVFERELR